MSDPVFHCISDLCIFSEHPLDDSVRSVFVTLFGTVNGNAGFMRVGPIATPRMPPLLLLIDLSRRVTKVTFRLSYKIDASKCGGEMTFRTGKVVAERHDDRVMMSQHDFLFDRLSQAKRSPDRDASVHVDPAITWLAAKLDQRAPIGAVDVDGARPVIASLPSLRSVAEELLSRGVVVGGRDPLGINGVADYQHIKALLPKKDQHALDRLEARSKSDAGALGP